MLRLNIGSTSTNKHSHSYVKGSIVVVTYITVNTIVVIPATVVTLITVPLTS